MCSHEPQGKAISHATSPAALDGVLPGPLARRRFIAGSVGLVDMCDLGDERIVGVGVCQHRADAQ
jgi:hypothetical protein